MIIKMCCDHSDYDNNNDNNNNDNNNDNNNNNNNDNNNNYDENNNNNDKKNNKNDNYNNMIIMRLQIVKGKREKDNTIQVLTQYKKLQRLRGTFSWID